MRSLHRAVVTGAFAGLAGVTAVASVAFACTPEATVEVTKWVNDPVEPPDLEDVEIVQPGEAVVIVVDNFHPITNFAGAGEVVVTWEAMPQEGFETPAPKPLAILPPFRGWKKVALPGPDEVDAGPYLVAARQFNKETGELVGERTDMVTMMKGDLVRTVSVPTTQPPTPSTRPNTTVTSIPGSRPIGDEGTIVGPPLGAGDPAGDSVAGPAQGSAPGRAGARAGSGDGNGLGNGNGNGNGTGTGTRSGTGSGTGSGSGSGGGGADSGQGPGGPSGPGGRGGPGGGRGLDEDVLANIPSIPGSDAAKMLDRLNGKSEPVTGDLWSGLDPSRSSSLLDTGAPAEDGSGFPVGGLLLGGGVLALAAVALVEGRRRLAVSRVTLR